MRVLIAEDDPIIRRLLEVTLSKWGYSVVLAGDGVEAWRILQTPDSPRLILLDWMMPGMDGPEVCQRLRSSGPRLAYVILLTAKGRKEDIITGLEAGADDYVTKPFDRDELKARVEVGARIISLQQEVADRQRELAVARAVAVERARFDAAIAEMSDGIVVADRDWRISEANHAACLLLNLPEEGYVGTQLGGTLEPFTLSVPFDELNKTEPRETAVEIARAHTSPPLYIDGRLTRLFEPDGGFAGVVLTLRDVTLERQSQVLRASFLDLVSHKLRTPIAVMSAYLQLMGRMSPERRAERVGRLVEVFSSELRLLEGQVATLLEFKELELVSLSQAEQRADVARAIADAAGRVRADYQDRVFEVHAEVGPEGGYVAVDAAHLDLLLSKVMDNAVKFGNRSPVVIKAKSERVDVGRVRIAISDNGPGIPHEYFDRILNGFIQIEERATGQIAGMGLGLALAKRIVDAYGGSISLQSKLGEGTTVSLVLPAVPPT